MEDSSLPQESDSQLVGDEAVSALISQKPAGWKFDEFSGSHDVGIDAHIQLVKNKSYVHAFRAQVKGSRIDSSSADKKYFSVPLKVTTAKFLSRLGPMMLIYVDFSSVSDPHAAPIYYVWLNDILEERLAEIQQAKQSQIELTIRVPANQRVTRDLDISGYLDDELRKQQSLSELNKAIAGVEVTVPPEIRAESLAANVQKGGAVFLESALGDGEFLWPEAKPGSNGWVLRQLRDAITAGAVPEAVEYEKRVSELEMRDNAERAEASFQRGRLAVLQGNKKNAIKHYAEATSLRPQNPRYLIARVETRLGVEDHTNIAKEELEVLESSALASDPRVVSMRARMLVILDQYVEAARLLEGIELRYSILELMLLATLSHDHDRVAELLEVVRTLDVPRQTRLAVRILAARANFWAVFRVKSGDSIPPTGPPQLDVDRLTECWRLMSELAEDLKANRWPVNSNLLMEVLAPVAIAAGRANQGLVLVDDFLKERPHYQECQSLRMKLALHANRPDIALQAVKSEPESDSRTVNEVLISYADDDYPRVISLIGKLMAVQETEPLLEDALVVAALSADRLFKRHESEACLARLAQLVVGEELTALYKYLSKANSAEDAREAALVDFQKALERFPESHSIQDHLIAALRPSKPDEATLALAVAEKVKTRRLLTAHEVAHVARCLEALGRRSLALTELEVARRRLPDNVEIAALQALLLEKDGDTKHALKLLESLLGTEEPIAERCRTAYINLAARNGMTDLAIRQFETLLARATERKEKADILRSIFSLELHRGAISSRLTSLALSYGEIADQRDEFEEGMYLQLMMTSGMGSTEPLPAHLQNELNERAERFFAAFPHSTYLSRIQMSNDASPAEFLDAIRKTIGLTEDQIVEFEKRERDLEHGELLAPYAWRPRIILRNVATISHLWELTKRSNQASRAYGLLLSDRAQEPRDFGRFTSIPLIDYPTLLLLTDLDLWDVVFSLFDQIAISKWTLLRIQTDAGPLGFPTTSLMKLRDIIRDRVDRILQPGTIDEDWIKVRDGGLDDAKGILKDARFAFYGDDYLARLFVLGDEGARGGLTTLDLIATAERMGGLTAREAAARVAKLVDWNIANVWISNRHVLAAIPANVDGAKSVDDKFSALLADPVFRSLIDSAWSINKPYKDISEHFSSFLAGIVNDMDSLAEDLAAAIFSLWFNKVRLRPDVPVPPDQHLGYAMARIVARVRDREDLLRKAWGIYRRTVEWVHRARMDKAIERNAIALVGDAFRIIGRKFGEDAIVPIVEKAGRGLTGEPGEYDEFWRGFRKGVIK